jgi:hypothetical protein
MTVLDMLHKVGVEDNISYYAGKGGKSDFVLNIVWHSSFTTEFKKHLCGVNEKPKLDNQMEDETQDRQKVTIADCFNEFRKEELLDEDNMWYCNKCKDHVQATK